METSIPEHGLDDMGNEGDNGVDREEHEEPAVVKDDEIPRDTDVIPNLGTRPTTARDVLRQQLEGQGLSKSAMNRQIRQAQKAEHWKAAKEKKKALKKEKALARKETEKEPRAKRERIPAHDATEGKDTAGRYLAKSEMNANVGKRALESGYKLVVDMDFRSMMTEKEQKSLTQQISYCYSANRKAEVPAQIWLTGVSPESRTDLQKFVGFETWPAFTTCDKCYTEIFPKEDIIYLTADAKDELQALEKGKAYVIGGIVDRNRYKKLTLDKAAGQGVATARLPIARYLELLGSKVLTVNQMFDILLKVIGTDGDFKLALEDSIPNRKRNTEAENSGSRRAAKRVRGESGEGVVMEEEKHASDEGANEAIECENDSNIETCDGAGREDAAGSGSVVESSEMQDEEVVAEETCSKSEQRMEAGADG